MITAPVHSLAEQATSAFPLSHLINEMVGDVARMEVYVQLGFQIRQKIWW